MKRIGKLLCTGYNYCITFAVIVKVMKFSFVESNHWSKHFLTCAVHSCSSDGRVSSQSPCHALIDFHYIHTAASSQLPQWPLFPLSLSLPSFNFPYFVYVLVGGFYAPKCNCVETFACLLLMKH